MNKIILSIFFLIIFIIALVPVKTESLIIEDILLGTSPLKLYSYKFGILQVSYGETLYIKIVSKIDFKTKVALSFTNTNKTVIEQTVFSNEIIALYTFNSSDYGYYRLKVYSPDNSFIVETNIRYTALQASLDNFNYYLKNENNGIYLISNLTLRNIQPSPSAKYYIALLYDGFFINYTGQLVMGIESGIEGRTIVRYGVAIVEQDILKNEMVIKPRILNSTNKYINITMDYLYIEIYYYNSFSKNLNGTQLFTFTPSYIYKNNYTNFVISNESIKIKFDIKTTGIIFLNMTAYKSEGSIAYRYSTHLVIEKDKVFQIISISEMSQNITGSMVNLYGGLNLDLYKIIKYNDLNIFKNLYVSIIYYDAGYTNIFYKKFDYNFLLIKIYNIAKNRFLTNFTILAENSISYINNDTSIIFYISIPKELYIEISNAIIPLKYIYNFSLEDNSEYIIKAEFYELNITAVAGDLLKPNITISIFLNNKTLIYNETLLYGRTNLLLPKGFYLIEAKRERYNTTRIELLLTKDIQLRIELYPRELIRNDPSTFYSIFILSLILVIHATINYFLYRRIERLKSFLYKKGNGELLDKKSTNE